MWDVVEIRCPYCFERVEVLLDPEQTGELFQDCEVCCNPWKLRVFRDPDGTPRVTAEAVH